MNELKINEETKTITTLEIAEMMMISHRDILNKLCGTRDKSGKQKQVGIIPILTKANFRLSEYFIESSYIDGSGRENKCYLVTKLGCDFLANKFTGEKGILFTAKYVKRFSEMEKIILSDDQLKSKLLLSIYDGGQDAVVASKELTKLEVAAATAPLQKEIVHKQDVINGLTDDIPLYEKPDIINRICRRSYGGYASRYKELYKCFRENFHTDLMIKCENYNEKQIKKKDRLTVIRYAEEFGYIDDLYSCCVKLYETEVQEILEELNELR